MISIPVMTDETVVRRQAHANVVAAEESVDYHHSDAAAQEDGADSAAMPTDAGAGFNAAQMPWGAAQGHHHHSSNSNSHNSNVIHHGSGMPSTQSRGGPDLGNAAAYATAAVPCANSILDVGPAPAAVAAPVDMAPPEMPPLAQYCALALQLRCDRSQDQDQNYRSCFHSSRVPSISLWDYVRRFAKYSLCSEECFIVAMVLMDRYVSRTNVPITLRNVHRLYITAMTLSVKLRDDSYYSNAYYASIGGVLNGELNVLELELLDTVQWFTWVERSVYDAYIQRLEHLFYPAMPQPAASPSPRRN